MDIAKYYTQPLSSGYYQSASGLYSALKEKLGKEDSPSLKQVKEFLNQRKSHYLFTPREASRRRIKRGQSARWITRSAVGIIHADTGFLDRCERM